MTVFPYADLPLVAEARFDGVTFTDLSSRLTDDPINVQSGRQPGAQRTEAGSASLVLNNDDGELTPLREQSAYWPYIDTGLEMRLRQRWAYDTFTRSLIDSLGSTDDGLAWALTGTAANFDVNGSAATVVFTATSTVRTAIVTPPFAVGDACATMSWSALATGAGGFASHVGVGSDGTHLYAARMLWAVGGGIQFEIGRIDGSGFYNIGGGVDLDHTYTANQQYSIRVQVAAGGFVLGKMWQGGLAVEPAAWTLVGIDTTVADWGLSPLTDLSKAGFTGYLQAGNTNSSPVLSVHDFQVNYDIAHGEVGDWNPDFIPTTDGEGEDLSVVRVQLAGVLRRLTQGTKPEKSAPLRWLESLAAPADQVPVAAWTLEERRLASGGEPTFGSEVLRPFVGTHPSGAIISFPQWGAGDLGPWLPPVVSRSGSAGASVMWAPVSMPGFTDSWTIDITYASTSDAPESAIDVNPSYLGGALGWPQMSFDPANSLILVTFGGLPETDYTVPDLFDGLPHAVRFIYAQNGGNVEIFTYIDGSLVGPGGAVYAGTLTAITTLGHTALAGSGPLAVGYLTVWDDTIVTSFYSDAVAGTPGEMAHDRAVRLADEESVPLVAAGVRSPEMGHQYTGTLGDILGQCEDVAQGVLGEAGPSLAFTALSARYNAAASLTVDLSTYRTESAVSRRVLAPQFNDAGRITRFTAHRPDGGSATYPASLPTPLYEAEDDFHVLDDDQLGQVARYKVYRGQRIAMRHPNTPLNLGENSSLIGGWMKITRMPGLGRIVRSNVPTKYGTVDIDEMVDGFSQTLTRRSWKATFDGTPTALLTAPKFDDTDARYGSASSVLTAAVDGDDTTLSVMRGATRKRWITGSATPPFPFDLAAAGEQIRVSSIASTAADAFTRSVSNSWGGSWTTSGGVASDFAVGGTEATITLSTATTVREALYAATVADGEILLGKVVNASGWIPTGADISTRLAFRNASSTDCYEAELVFDTSDRVTLKILKWVGGGVTVLGSAALSLPGSTVAYALRVQFVGTRLLARAWDRSKTEPRAWHVDVTDSAWTTGSVAIRAHRLTSNTNVNPNFAYDDFEITGPQVFTVARSINGVTRSHASGTPVTLWKPAVYAY